MPFEKIVENHFHELDQSTKYRFAEIEITHALNTLTYLYQSEMLPRQKAFETIMNALVPNDHEQRAEFVESLNSKFGRKPVKKEIIQYLIIKGHSYEKIRQIAKTSFTTISRMRYDLPYYHPVYRYWTPEMLQKWNMIKPVLNLFQDELTHTKEKKTNE